MTQKIAIKVHGTPAPQGSKRHVGGGRMVESSKKVKPWREAVETAAQAAVHALPHFQTFTGPVRVRVDFTIERPRSHFRSGRFAKLVKDTAPDYVSVKPDIDKLLRSTFDALSTAGVWKDDNLAAIVTTTKTYGVASGAYITLEEILP